MLFDTDIKLGLKGIDHPAIAAHQVDELADWYCDVLGYKPYYRHAKPVRLLQAPDGTLLEIMPVDENPRPQRTTWTPGWSHVALRIDNMGQAICFLDKYGVTWGGELIEAVGGGSVRTFYDPEGNMLQLIERPQLT